MKLKSFSLALMVAMLASSCANEEVIESNSDVRGNAIGFRPMVGHAKRSVETTINNLGDFAVYAKGVHPQGALYTSFLIGNEDGGEVAKFDKSEIVDGKGTWTLDRNVYWPSNMDHVLFWAYTTLQRDNNTNVSESSDKGTLSSGTISFDGNTGPQITGFEPAKADLTATSETGIWQDGLNQKDLLIAFTSQDKNTGNTVGLNFKHALSQINITAQQVNKANNDHRIVKIKGAWIVNTKNKGNLSAGFSWDPDTHKATEKPEWTLDNTSAGHYGSYNKDQVGLDATAAKGLLGDGGNLMIIPQTVSEYNGTDGDTGAYILLLCRVELKHAGDTHTGNDGDLGDIAIPGDGYHYHQQFPVTSAYNKEEYGFTCVKLNATWEMGKRYTYTLDICGRESGAGVYPPEISNDMLNELVPAGEQTNIIRTRPTDKKVGDPVLDEPIKFSVSVDDWSEDGEWKPGNGTF